MSAASYPLTYHIVTFGCQMNVHDSERISGILQENGMREVYAATDADLVIFNTCSVRQKAEEKYFTALGRLKNEKKRRRVLISVAGCTAQIRAQEIVKKAPYVDLIFGPRSINRLWGNLQAVLSKKQPVVDVFEQANMQKGQQQSRDDEVFNSASAVYSRPSKARAYVTIMEGCNNYCAYCVVPFARGPEIYRPLDHVIHEVETLADQEFLEVILLGQNVNSYRWGQNDFAELLERVGKVKSLKRIRFITSHPAFFSTETVRVMAEYDNVCAQLHLPIQSGSNAILKAMNRKYTIEKYMDIIDTLKYNINNISLSTDIIVGFPGEREQDFEDTLAALKKIRFDQIFSFRYSVRPFTKAAKIPDSVPLEEKRRRLMELQEIQRGITLENNKAEIGRITPVLVEGNSRKNREMHMGRSENNKVVNFSDAPAGIMDTLVNIEIQDATQNSLLGTYRGAS